MRRVIVVAMVLAACSGRVRSSTTTTTTGAAGTSNGQGGTGSSIGGATSSGGNVSNTRVCSDLTYQACQCADGAPGTQHCQRGTWNPCTCGYGGGSGAGGVPNTGVCGDGIVQAGEQCDGQNQPGTCATVSMGACPGGYLICTATCQYDYTACICGAAGVPNTRPVCGDGIVSGGEQCDGKNIPETCAIVSMGACRGGYLICTANCIYDYSACICTDTDAG